MSRVQSVNGNGEELSSMYVAKLDPESPDFVLYFDKDDGRTRQEFSEDADVNVLMARFEKTGQLPSNVGMNAPAYLDVSEVPDLMTALQVVEQAKTAFMSLPAKARAEFDNDPVAFMNFAQDPDNLDRMREWGLAAPEVAPEPPLKVEVINAAGDAPAAKGAP